MSWRCQWWMTYLFNDKEWRPLMDIPFQQLQRFGLLHCNKDSYSDFVCPVHQWLQWWGLCSTSQQDYGRERIVETSSNRKWSNEVATYILVATLGSPKAFICCYKIAFSYPHIKPSFLASTWWISMQRMSVFGNQYVWREGLTAWHWQSSSAFCCQQKTWSVQSQWGTLVSETCSRECEKESVGVGVCVCVWCVHVHVHVHVCEFVCVIIELSLVPHHKDGRLI